MKNVLLHVLIITVLGFIVCIPYFSQLNFLILDTLQGDIEPRDDIVIIGIDDRTLGEIGAWPWTRDIFATAITELQTHNPKVVGFDILFLEEREGDPELRQAIESSTFPIVFGNKLVEGSVYESIFTGNNATAGYTNFVPDADTKIRRTTIATQIDNECRTSFALATLRAYLGMKSEPSCDETITLSSRIEYDRNLQFLYPEDSFSYISFLDVYNGNFNTEDVKGKIILIGSTATDLKSGLLDNFTDVFGQNRAGVSIHASIINSFLSNSFQTDVPLSVFLPTLLFLTTLLFLVYRLLKKSLLEFGTFLVALFVINIFGLAIFEYGYNWPILQSNILLTASYVFYIAYKYLVESREKRFIKQAFGKYINPKLLNQLIKEPDMLKLGGERKEITVLFSDIQGYTSVAEKLTPEELLEYTNSYFDVETNVIINHNGTIDKYIGDAIMAFWNAPVDDPNHRLNAIQTAIKMQKALHTFNAAHPQLPDIHCGIGLNTDRMIVGNMGSSRRYNYTLIGDGVNLGSRIEGLTRKYGVKILVTENVLKTIDLKNQHFLARLLDEVQVKGKAQSVTIYEILDKSEQNISMKNAYENAFKLYQAGDFEQAKKIFETLRDDSPSQVLLERITQLKNLKGWKGIWKWEKK